MSQITITWKAFGNRPELNRCISSATFQLAFADASLDICESIYKVTNLQDDLNEFGARKFELDLWKTIKSILPANRTHTSLSIGDEITIDDKTYQVSSVGFVEHALV